MSGGSGADDSNARVPACGGDGSACPHATMLAQAPGIHYVAGPDRRWVYLSPQVEALLGWTPEEIVADPTLFDAAVHHEDRAAARYVDVRPAIGSRSRTGGVRREFRVLTRDGGIRWLRDEAQPVARTPGEPQLWTGVLTDVTDRKALEEHLRRQAQQDAVTGLPNRWVLHQRVTDVLEQGRAGAVVLVAIEDFWAVRDSLGHAAGDEMLRGIAARLCIVLPGEGVLARVTDHEFALLLPSTGSPDAAVALAAALPDTVRSATLWMSAATGTAVSARISVGIRHWTADEDCSADEVVSDAAAARVDGARLGRVVSVFEPRMRAERLRRLQLTEALEHAADRGELSVHYQPYFAFADGRARGVEALARWRHPGHGNIPPGEFILLAESTGQIHALGTFVLTRACHDIARLRREHPAHADLRLSVNISARQLVDDRFQQQLREVLVTSGLPGDALTLELTETALVEDIPDAAVRLADIRTLGVHLALDDFGTLYASLSYLQRFPIDTLKVDRSFVSRLHESPDDHRLAGAIIAMAKTLEMHTIAEGIEQGEHARSLANLGCDAGQGYLLARPVALDGLREALVPQEQPVGSGWAR